MNDLGSTTTFKTEHESTNSLVSHMLMGFVERKISPQTIADVLRAQIFEANVPVELLTSETCNGILEAITNSSATEECSDLIIYLSEHEDFPNFLSFKAVVGTLKILIRFIHKNIIERYETLAGVDVLVEKLSERMLHFLHEGKGMELEDKTQLTQILKTNVPAFTKLMRNKVHYQHLRFMLMTPNDYMHEHISTTGTLPTLLEVLSIIVKTNDDVLLKNGISYYKTQATEKNSVSRIKYFQTVFDVLGSSGVSDFKFSFVIEWLFEKALVDAVLNENTSFEFVSTVKLALECYCLHVATMRGFIKALQKDYSFLATHPLQKLGENKQTLIDKANALLDNVFPPLVGLNPNDIQVFGKFIANWAMEMPVQNDDHRFFKRIHWRWVKALALQSWDASLREPQAWIISNGSSYAALIFHMAPANWLQEYAYPLLERIYAETLVDHFEATEEYVNYIEFLVRSMRKKSPFIASRSESLYALHLLSRMTRTESLQFTSVQSRFMSQITTQGAGASSEKTQEYELWEDILLTPNCETKFGTNPVSQSLAVLLRLTFEIAKK